MAERMVTLERSTNETQIELTLDLDGTGRYVRLGDDSTIYLLPTASLDPLMRVSVNGLEN